MTVMKCILIVAAISLATASTTLADPATPTSIDDLKGRVIRVVYPGEIITMDCRLDRVTIYVDENNKITKVNFC